MTSSHTTGASARQELTPILKWVGGKRQLLDFIRPLIPEHTTYCEPFVGGGAVFFDLQPKKAVINDFNQELINVYQTVKEQPEELIELLLRHREQNSQEYFYQIRALDREPEKYEELTPAQRAARIIYLNKTCYNGLFRVNSAGQFNAPWGRYKNPNIVPEDNIRAMSRYLNNPLRRLQGSLEGAEKGSLCLPGSTLHASQLFLLLHRVYGVWVWTGRADRAEETVRSAEQKGHKVSALQFLLRFY